MRRGTGLPKMFIDPEGAHSFYVSIFGGVEHLRWRSWPGVTPGSYLDRSYGWRTVAILAELGRASLVERIPKHELEVLSERRQSFGWNLAHKGAATGLSGRRI
jgi:hypothetical protein